MNTFVISDIHGCLSQLKQCIEQAKITREDKIIFLGDYVDRGEDSFGVIEFILKLSKTHEVVCIRGNHDDAFYNKANNGNFMMWKHGARETVMSYIKGLNLDRTITEIPSYSTDFTFDDIPDIHKEFYDNLLPYYIDENNNCYVHGGFNRNQFIETQQPEDIYWWDRDLVHSARSWSMMTEESQQYKFKIKGSGEFGKFKEIFVGHTPVQMFTPTLKLSNGKEGLLINMNDLLSTPQQYANIWVCDTGAGKFENGLVTIMNVETKEYYQC